MSMPRPTPYEAYQLGPPPLHWVWQAARCRSTWTTHSHGCFSRCRSGGSPSSLCRRQLDQLSVCTFGLPQWTELAQQENTMSSLGLSSLLDRTRTTFCTTNSRSQPMSTSLFMTILLLASANQWVPTPSGMLRHSPRATLLFKPNGPLAVAVRRCDPAVLSRSGCQHPPGCGCPTEPARTKSAA